MPALQDELGRLTSLAKDKLRVEWRRYFHAEPPAGLSRDLLLRAVTYKVQERVQGGLSQGEKRSLATLAAKPTGEGASGALHLPSTLRPGVRMVREWGGRTHTPCS